MASLLVSSSFYTNLGISHTSSDIGGGGGVNSSSSSSSLREDPSSYLSELESGGLGRAREEGPSNFSPGMGRKKAKWLWKEDRLLVTLVNESAERQIVEDIKKRGYFPHVSVDQMTSRINKLFRRAKRTGEILYPSRNQMSENEDCVPIPVDVKKWKKNFKGNKKLQQKSHIQKLQVDSSVTGSDVHSSDVHSADRIQGLATSVLSSSLSQVELAQSSVASVVDTTNSSSHTNSDDTEEIVEASGSVLIRESMSGDDRSEEVIRSSTLHSSYASTSTSTSTSPSLRPSIQEMGSDSERTETEDERDELSVSAASSTGLKRRVKWINGDVEKLDAGFHKTKHSSTSTSTPTSTSTSTRPSIQEKDSDTGRTEIEEDEGDELSSSAASSRGLKRGRKWTEEDAEKICACFNKTKRYFWIASEASKIFPHQSNKQIQCFWYRLTRKIIDGKIYLEDGRSISINMEKLKRFQLTDSAKRKRYAANLNPRTWQDDQRLAKMYNTGDWSKLSDYFPGQNPKVVQAYFHKILNPNSGRIDKTGRLYPGPYQVGRVEGEFIQIDINLLRRKTDFLWYKFLDARKASASVAATSSTLSGSLSVATTATEIDKDDLADLPPPASLSSVNAKAVAAALVSLSSSSSSSSSSSRKDNDNDKDDATLSTVARTKRSHEDLSNTSLHPSIQEMGSDSERTETEDERDELSGSAASSRGLKRGRKWTDEDVEKICACFNKTEKTRWINVEASKIFPTKSFGQIRSFWYRLTRKIIDGKIYLEGGRSISINMEKIKKFQPTESTRMKRCATWYLNPRHQNFNPRTWQDDQRLAKMYNTGDWSKLSDYFPGQKPSTLRNYFYRNLDPNSGRIDEKGRLFPGPHQIGRVEGEFIQINTLLLRRSKDSPWYKFLDARKALASAAATSSSTSSASLSVATTATEIDKDDLADSSPPASLSSVNAKAVAAAQASLSSSSSSSSSSRSSREDDDNDKDDATSSTVARKKRSHEDLSNSIAKRSRSK